MSPAVLSEGDPNTADECYQVELAPIKKRKSFDRSKNVESVTAEYMMMKTQRTRDFATRTRRCSKFVALDLATECQTVRLTVLRESAVNAYNMTISKPNTGTGGALAKYSRRRANLASRAAFVKGNGR
jgi:hypothetical protein